MSKKSKILEVDKSHEAEMAIEGITDWERKQLDIGYSIASPQREHLNYSLGILLTAVEAALGDTVQAKALKDIIRREMFALADKNQSELYKGLGVQKIRTDTPPLSSD